MHQQTGAGARHFPPPLAMLPKVAMVIWVIGLGAGFFSGLLSEPQQAPRQLFSWVLLSLARTPATAEVTAVTPNWGRGGVRPYDVHYVFRSPDGTERRHVQRILTPLVAPPSGRHAHTSSLDIVAILERDMSSAATKPMAYRAWHSPLLPSSSAIHVPQLGTYCFKALLMFPLLMATFITLWIVGLSLIAHGFIWLRSRWRGAAG